MFLEAQRRFEQNSQRGKAFSSSYVSDVLRNYGDHGRKIPLKQSANADFEKALQFRNREKQEYEQLRRSHTKMLDDNRKMHFDNYQLWQNTMGLRRHVNDGFSQDMKRHDSSRSGLGVVSRDSGGGVLPAEDRASADDAHDGQPEEIISSTEAGENERPHARNRRSRAHDVDQRQQTREPSSEVRAQRSDTGRSLDGPSDGPEPDVGGSADQHSAEERREGG
jgi:hypothetical protein